MNSKFKVEALEGDITKLKVDAIVNAANQSLLGGSGVDGAIHRAAGPDLLEECRKLGGCKTGDAKITNGYCLPAKYVIHTVGPVWRGGTKREDELLSSCYFNSLTLAEKHGIHSIAFPSISTGAYKFPLERAANIAVRTIYDFLSVNSKIEKIVLVAFSKNDYEVFMKAISFPNQIF